MITREFGWTKVQVPVIGQGTWMIEGNREAERNAIEALQAGIELGMTHIDTAEMYGGGRAEELVGDAIRGRRRERLSGRQGAALERLLPRHPARLPSRACGGSAPNRWISTCCTGAAASAGRDHARDGELADAGEIRFIGVSNFDTPAVREAQHALAASPPGLEPGAVPPGRPRHRAPPAGTTAAARRSPWWPTAPSATGNFPGPRSPAGACWAEVGARHNRTPRQVALNFLARHPHVFVIPKSSQAGHTRENAGGAGWDLTPEDIAAIDRAFPAPTRDVPLGMI